MPDFDVIVVGGGAVGEVLAGRTAAAGLSTALVESELVGGECSYWACIPSKSLLRPLAVLKAARRVKGASNSVGDVDAAAALEARNEAVNNYDDHSQVEWVKNANIHLIRGRARLDGERRVVVDGTEYLANRAIVLATGSTPVLPPIPGLSEIDPWTSRDATSAKGIPDRLAILGGGVVAVEMAQAFHSLGTKQVTLLVRGDRLIEREESFASEELAKAFAADGIDVRLSTELSSVRRLDDGAAELTLGTGDVLITDQLLVATGRKPATADLGVDTIGLTPGKPIEVDDQMRSTKHDWLYAIGDVNGIALLTHMGKYQARIASDVIAGKSASAWANTHAVPGVIFTDPQIASVGLKLADAKQQGIDARELKVPLSSAAGAFVNGNLQGTAQLVVDDSRKVVVGATFTGPEVGEMLQSATIAIAGEVTLDKLWHAVPAYPTVSEVWLRLLEQYGL